MYFIHKICPRLLEELLRASFSRLLQRELSVVPELVCWCDQSPVKSPETCWADLGSQPAALSWVAVAVGWQSDRQGYAIATKRQLPRPQCPALIDTRPHTHPS